MSGSAITTTSQQPHDLVELGHLTEDAIVNAIRTRFLQDKIYTRIRNATLVVVNPYKDIIGTSLAQVSEQYLNEYKEPARGGTNNNNSTSSSQLLDPHIFQHVNQAYFHMRRSGRDQSMIFRHVYPRYIYTHDPPLTKQNMYLGVWQVAAKQAFEKRCCST